MAASSWGRSCVCCLPWLLPLDKKHTLSYQHNQWGVVLEGVAPAVCLPMTCSLIGSSRNLLCWMLCAGIAASKESTDTRQEERQRGRLPCSVNGEERLRGGVKEEKGEYPVFSALLCYCSPSSPPPPPSLYDSLSLSFSLLICFCAERKGTCRSLMIQPFSCSTDKTACPSCHCSAWLSCPLHYNYCSCSRPVTSTLPLLPKCSGE